MLSPLRNRSVTVFPRWRPRFFIGEERESTKRDYRINRIYGAINQWNPALEEMCDQVTILNPTGYPTTNVSRVITEHSKSPAAVLKLLPPCKERNLTHGAGINQNSIYFTEKNKTTVKRVRAKRVLIRAERYELLQVREDVCILLVSRIFVNESIDSNRLCFSTPVFPMTVQSPKPNNAQRHDRTGQDTTSKQPETNLH